MFVNWALRSVRDSLIQVDPLAAAIAYKGQRKAIPTSAISQTPLLLQFAPFGTATLDTCLPGRRNAVECIDDYRGQ
ncbi:unnamed protein product [Anisakis simplex]|uniref:Transposase n=1 Tax=Anisakis simplex TaxID=6269 RepID=A0A0M3K0K1_ANISI|nr:unnamed protein product [Anisakis simplex]